MRRLSLLTMLACAAGFSECAITSVLADERIGSAPPAYASPQAVCEAFRDAEQQGDWRTVFYCGTSEARNWLVFDAWSACKLQPPQQKGDAQALLKQYGVEGNRVDAEYSKRYHLKHGVDVAKLLREGQQLPAPDDNLFRDVVCDFVADKVGFYEAQNKLKANSTAHDRLAPEIGRLESVRVHGDRATGNVRRMTYHVSNEGDGAKRLEPLRP